MKAKITAMLGVILLGCGAASAQEYRTFTSADGSKKLEAKLVDYDSTKGTVSLTLKNGSKIKTDIKNFTAEDGEYAQAQMEKLVASRRLDVRIAEIDNVTGEKKSTAIGGTIISRDAGYSIELRNNGQVGVSGVTAKYKIFAATYGPASTKKGDREMKISSGEVEWTGIDPRQEQVSNTQTVAMTSVKPLAAKECAGGT